MKPRRLFLPAALMALAALFGCASPTPATGPSVPSEVAPTPPAPPPPPPAEEEVPPMDFKNNVYFDFGKTEVNAQGKATIAKHAQRLKRNPKLVVTLVGRTDNLGSRPFNQAVAEERLDSVVRIFANHGIDRRQIRRMAIGNEKSNSASCRSDACRQTMRRVEMVYDQTLKR